MNLNIHEILGKDAARIVQGDEALHTAALQLLTDALINRTDPRGIRTGLLQLVEANLNNSFIRSGEMDITGEEGVQTMRAIVLVRTPEFRTAAVNEWNYPVDGIEATIGRSVKRFIESPETARHFNEAALPLVARDNRSKLNGLPLAARRITAISRAYDDTRDTKELRQHIVPEVDNILNILGLR